MNDQRQSSPFTLSSFIVVQFGELGTVGDILLVSKVSYIMIFKHFRVLSIFS